MFHRGTETEKRRHLMVLRFAQRRIESPNVALLQRNSATENAMLRSSLMAAVAAAALLGGCAYDGDRDDYVVGASVGYHDVYYDGFYDCYYGPFYDGYWGTD
jgi:hypothetical protein